MAEQEQLLRTGIESVKKKEPPNFHLNARNVIHSRDNKRVTKKNWCRIMNHRKSKRSLGHKSIKTTMIYTHINDTQKREIKDLLQPEENFNFHIYKIA
jgi:integrase